MVSPDQDSPQLDVVLTISPPLGTKIFDYVPIFIQRAIFEKAGLVLSRENFTMTNGPDHSTTILLRGITTTARDAAINVLKADGYGVTDAPYLSIFVSPTQEGAVA